jgi:hypothetical protein
MPGSFEGPDPMARQVRRVAQGGTPNRATE